MACLSNIVKQTVVPVLLLVAFTVTVPAQPVQEETKPDKGVVVLLHGLARTSASMNKLQKALEKEGFETCNIDYPSTRYTTAVLVSDYVLPKIRECISKNDLPLNFVTHSLGGIIVRYLAKEELISHIGRVVMLSPPNKGSEVVDVLGDTWLFGRINGPAGRELGTGRNSLPLQLGQANFEAGIITGNKSINLILSVMIDGEDDGKVSVENAKLEEMKDFLVLPLTHPFIMKDETTIKQTIYFLNFGKFSNNNL
jgi:triacylglycerol lipase